MANNFQNFLTKHGLQIAIIVLTGFGVVMIYRFKVDANAQGIGENKKEIKRVDAKYPDKEWFDLKFDHIDEKFDDADDRFERLENKIDGKAVITRF